MAPPIFHWFLPTEGDGRGIADSTRSGLSSSDGARRGFRYLAQVAATADLLGFSGALTPVGTSREEPWIMSAALARETTSLRFLVAMRPSTMTPTLTAQMAASFQELSGNRLALNIVAGGDSTEMRRFGVALDHDQRYAQTDEFLTVLRGAWSPEPFSFRGEYYDVEDARVQAPVDVAPPIYFGGASAAAERVAARHSDVYLAWGEPLEMLAERVERMRALAAEAGRTLRFGVRMQVISRNSAEEAWAVTERMMAEVPEASIKLAQRRMKRLDSVGQQRLNALHGGGTDNLVVGPNLWSGISLIRASGSTALVGSHSEVAERIREMQAIGFDEFIFGGLPHVEEAYHFAEGVMPLFAGDTSELAS